MAYGAFADIPSEIFRSVVETNLMGQVHGSRAALGRFRDQGAGVLVNVSSVCGRVSSPLVSAYVVSKNAPSRSSIPSRRPSIGASPTPPSWTARSPRCRRGTRPGTSLHPIAPHAVEAGWKRHHRPVLRRALRDAIGGGMLGLLGRSSPTEGLAQDAKNRRG
jgi:hypothetical protein